MMRNSILYQKYIIPSISLALFFLMYGKAEAQTFADFIDDILIATLTPVVTLIISLMLLYFFWGVAEFLFASDDQKKMEDGKKKIFTSVVALFVGLSVWGIVYLLQVTFNFTR